MHQTRKRGCGQMSAHLLLVNEGNHATMPDLRQVHVGLDNKPEDMMQTMHRRAANLPPVRPITCNV